jgi:glycosyltransferase involved in cell wall biosynthesis
VKLYAVIPTHNRHTELAELLDSIPTDVHVLVIDNASTPPIAAPSGAGFNPELPEFIRFLGRRIQVTRDEEQPPNLSRLWNIGLDWAAGLMPWWQAPEVAEEYAVAILNDDVVLPPGFIGTMARELDTHGVDIAFPGPQSMADHNPALAMVNRRKGPPGTDHRMTGWCFVVRGSSGLRADERLRWWCGDDDLEQQALQGGRGTVAVSPWVFQPEAMATGMPANNGGLRHRYPDQSTVGVLLAQTGKDMATFVKKWGFRPW